MSEVTLEIDGREVNKLKAFAIYADTAQGEVDGSAGVVGDNGLVTGDPVEKRTLSAVRLTYEGNPYHGSATSTSIFLAMSWPIATSTP